MTKLKGSTSSLQGLLGALAGVCVFLRNLDFFLAEKYVFRAFAEELLEAGALVCLSDVNQQVCAAVDNTS